MHRVGHGQRVVVGQGPLRGGGQRRQEQGRQQRGRGGEGVFSFLFLAAAFFHSAADFVRLLEEGVPGEAATAPGLPPGGGGTAAGSARNAWNARNAGGCVRSGARWRGHRGGVVERHGLAHGDR